MIDKQLERRRKLYSKLSSEIAQINNVQLLSLVDRDRTQSSFGENHVIDIERSKVFVKRVPVTNIEHENMFSTRNLYNLPTYYNYGLNSAGLGVFRELVTHIKTTNWVLEGAIATFPLLYHYRIVPFAGVHPEVDMERHRDYVAYWNSNANIGRYMLDRASANHELLLFLEYFPHTLADWLLKNPTKTSSVVDDALASLAFLRENGILHLDSHFFNILTDGKRTYLSDFGLALDRHFELSPAEKGFYKQNSYYDYGLLLWSLGYHLYRIYYRLPDSDKNLISQRYGVGAGADPSELMLILLNNIEDIASSGAMKIDKKYAADLARYGGIITLMHDFYLEMRINKAKDTPLDHAKLRRLIKETGLLQDAPSAR